MSWARRMAFVVLMAAVVGVPGCGPSLSKEDLGTIVYEVPKVPGSDQPYKLPPATAPPRASSKTDSSASKTASPTSKSDAPASKPGPPATK